MGSNVEVSCSVLVRAAPPPKVVVNAVAFLALVVLLQDGSAVVSHLLRPT